MTQKQIENVRKAIELLNGLLDKDLKEIQLKENEEKEDWSLKRKTAEILKKLGIPPHIKGYQYLMRIIPKVIQDGEKYFLVTKVLYPEIAKEFDTTPARVERAARHAIEVACDKGQWSAWEEVFGATISPDKGKPTNSEFFFQVAEHIKMKS